MQNIETLSPDNLELFDKICIEFVNDSDVFIGMKNNWPDWVTKSYAVDLHTNAVWLKLNEVLHPYIKYKTYNTFKLLLYHDELQRNIPLYVTISPESIITLQIYEI